MAIFILAALQVGLSLPDLDRLEYGEVMDLLTEHGNNYEHYDTLANQADFDKF